MLKIGIIGSGFGLYGLLPAFHSLKNCKVVAICAHNQERIKKYAYSRSITNTYSDWRKMLDEEKLDAVAIAVTPLAQYTIAAYAIKKGIHIFAEKPLAGNLPQAKELLRLAKKYNIIHAVDFLFPEISQWVKVKKLLDKKTYGNLKHISVNWDFLSFDIQHQISSWKTDVSQGGGALNFYSCHTLYYLENFVGEITDLKSQLIYSSKSINSAEVGVELLLCFKNQATGSVHISCNTVGMKRHQLIFNCEKATIVLENNDGFIKNFKITMYDEKGKNENIYKMPTQKSDESARVKAVAAIAQRFVLACKNNSQMQPSFEDGVRVQKLIEKIKNKSSDGRHRISH